MSHHHLHQQQTHPSFHQAQYVTVLGANDVLLGRGSGPNDHEGNIQFRKYVAERKQAYMATNHRLTKTKIAREIVDLVAGAGGRFLKKLEETPEQEVYEIVSDETVMEKAKQALRQNAGKKDVYQTQQSTQSGNTNTTTNAAVNPLGSLTLGDLEPIPFTDAGYSGPPPAASTTTTQDDLAAVWQLQQQQQQAVATAAFQQQQQQQEEQRQRQQQQQQQQQPQIFDPQLQQQQQQQSAYGSFASGGAGTATTQPYPYHQQQQRQMPPPLMRIPSIPTDQQQQQQQQHQQIYGYSNTAAAISLGPSNESLTPSIVSSEGSGSLGGGRQPRRHDHRASLTIADLPSASSVKSQMEDMADSFSKLSTSKQMMASSDTMGTIDYHEASMADMSINSSTFSIFKGGDSSPALDNNLNARNQFLLQSQQPHRNTVTGASSTPDAQNSSNHRDSSSSSGKTRDSGDSMSFSDLYEKGGKSSSLSCSVGTLIHDIRRQVDAEMASPVRNNSGTASNPTPTTSTTNTSDTNVDEDTNEPSVPVLGMDTLRASSLEVVKVLLPTESEAALELQASSSSPKQQQQQSSQQQRQEFYRQADPNRKTAGGV